MTLPFTGSYIAADRAGDCGWVDSAFMYRSLCSFGILICQLCESVISVNVCVYDDIGNSIYECNVDSIVGCHSEAIVSWVIMYATIWL